MDLDKAREIIAKHEARDENGKDICGCRWLLAEGDYRPHVMEYFEAKSFISGHASRDPEVENLKIKIMTLTNNANGTPWTQGEIEAASSRASQTERILELSAEVEKLKSCTKEKFSCPCGETTYLLEQNPNHFVGCISHNPTGVEDLKSQIESWKRTAGEAGKNWQQSAEASNELLEQLEAGREAARMLAETAQDVVWCLRKDDGKQVTIHDSCADHLEEALKFYATPGHSPEGRP